MLVDIYVREKNGMREIRIPILPEEISFKSGDATAVTFSIMDLGDVSIPSGTELDSWSWQSELPGALRVGDPLIRGTWYPPSEYDSILKDWKKNGTELTLLCVGYPINADVYLKEYHPSAAGPFGDIYYEIGFIEARQIVVASTKAASTETPTTRPAATSSTYTIKTGDSLWAIAAMSNHYGDGTKWKTIYEANKDIIESTANKYRKGKGSDNGHWIYPGVTLTIPGVGGSSKSTTGTNAPATTTAATEKTEKAKAEAYTSKRNQSIEASVQKAKKPLNSVMTIK